ncbi:MAG: hypothetical protein ACK2UM_09270 [Anaerolineales bacterium]|jgi:hypothetical protein
MTISLKVKGDFAGTLDYILGREKSTFVGRDDDLSEYLNLRNDKKKGTYDERKQQ